MIIGLFLKHIKAYTHYCSAQVIYLKLISIIATSYNLPIIINKSAAHNKESK